MKIWYLTKKGAKKEREPNVTILTSWSVLRSIKLQLLRAELSKRIRFLWKTPLNFIFHEYFYRKLQCPEGSVWRLLTFPLAISCQRKKHEWTVVLFLWSESVIYRGLSTSSILLGEVCSSSKLFTFIIYFLF